MPSGSSRRTAGSFLPAAVLLAVVLALAPLSACGGGAGPTTPPPSPLPSPSPRVLLISIDGLRPDAAISHAPAIVGLFGHSAGTWEAVTIEPPNTIPAHASMLTGVLPRVHGITWGDYQPARGLVQVQTVFSAAKAAGKTTAIITGKNGFRHYWLPGSLDHFFDHNGGATVLADEALRWLPRTDLMMVAFSDVDLTGHERLWMSDHYLAAVSNVDAEVARLVAAAPPQTTIILTADHGGNGFDHVGTGRQVMHVPWMLSGPRAAAGAPLPPVAILDTAPTVLHAHGVPIPAGMGGRVVTEAFAR